MRTMEQIRKEARAELIAELGRLQNKAENSMIDIMTITGFMKTNEEVEKHVASYR